jgi:prolyl 4-hydroxylase
LAAEKLNGILGNPGNLKEALQMTNELLKIVPYHQRALGNKRHYEKLLRQLGVTERRGETGEYVPFFTAFQINVRKIFNVRFLFFFFSEDNIDMSEPFDTAKLKLTKPPGTTEHWDVYEQLCRYDISR